jgi:hypothetical protein
MLPIFELMIPGTRPSVASPVQYQNIEKVAVSVVAEAALDNVSSNNPKNTNFIFLLLISFSYYSAVLSSQDVRV